LGQLLVDNGDISTFDQMRILTVQNRVEARFGDILLAHGLIGKERLYATIARQFGTEVADLKSVPPEARMIEALGAEFCLEQAILPWCTRHDQVLIATARPEQFEDHRALLETLFGPVRMVITGEVDLHSAVLASHPKTLTLRAETRVAEAESCRTWPTRWIQRTVMIALIIMVTGVVAFPREIFLVLMAWAILTLIASTLLKLTAAIAVFRAPQNAPDTRPAALPIIARLPTVSVLIPLFHEPKIAKRLIARMERLDYPRELLDICLVVEADDEATLTALTSIDLPGHIRVIPVPDSPLRTKPRALNYALDFCRGAIVGVYDAEDAPAPDQIRKVVTRFHERGPEVACLQGVLDFYNSRTNWLSRCFAVEYAAWFRVILPGIVRLGMVIPLGGTTLFFRRKALEALGGWDAHNVTEDADLGIRLARHGYRTELIDTVTEEEANCWFWPWVKQRSRWLKGYAITWAVHSRNPVQLWSDLGPWRFFGVQLFFLTTLSQFVLAPLLWSFLIIPLGLPHPFSAVASNDAFLTLSMVFIFAEVTTVSIGVFAVRDQAHRFLVPWVPTLVLYFPLAALAAYKGLLELLTRPFYWDKTQHGHRDDGTDPSGPIQPAE
jgi:cellulose synthase/poly-beta-1,6-N-acetylglucosamine synthase-like glycosyltransferase